MSKYILAMTCYERFSYLKRTLESLLESDLSLCKKIYLVDDCSRDPRIKKYLSNLPEIFEVYYNQKNLGVDYNMLKSYKIAFEANPESSNIVSIDSDCLYKKEWLTEIDKATNVFNDWGLITTFNTNVHQVVEKAGDYLIKKSAGGFSALMRKKLLQEVLEDKDKIANGAFELKSGDTSWDLIYNNKVHKNGMKIICTKTSFTDHIGKFGSHANGINFDQAENF